MELGILRELSRITSVKACTESNTASTNDLATSRDYANDPPAHCGPPDSPPTPATAPNHIKSTARSILDYIHGNRTLIYGDSGDTGTCDVNSETMAAYGELHNITQRIVDYLSGGITPASDTGEGAADSDLRLADDLANMIVDREFKHKEALSKEQTKAISDWRNWMREDFNRGAGRAHRQSRDSTAWAPTEVLDCKGILTGDLAAILDGQRRRFQSLWNARERPFEYLWDWGKQSCCGNDGNGSTSLTASSQSHCHTWDDDDIFWELADAPRQEELTRLTAQQLREGAMSFPKRTASTYDGFNPRHFGAVCDEGLDVLAIIFTVAEQSGIWPSQLRAVTMPLIPKPKGGFRPIGLLLGAYRLWAKARRTEADQWERRNPRAFFSAAAGNGPLDTVWRQAARQEAGTAEGLEAAATLDDLAAFYESISRDKLAEEAKATGFPFQLLKASLSMYAAPRLITMAGRIAKELYPRHGIIAGCALATTHVKVYYLRDLDRFVQEIPPHIHLDVHVDDVALSGEGPERQLFQDLVAARAKLIRLVERDIRGSIAQSKSTAVASSRWLAERLHSALGLAGAPREAIPNLGIDHVAGGSRVRLANASAKEGRWRAARRRGRRLRRITAALGSRAIRIFSAGVAPAASYGAAVWGMSEIECLRLRRLAGTALRPVSRGRSLNMLHLVHDMPTAASEVAVAVQYGRMVWNAVVARENAAMRRSDLGDISRIWDQVWPRVEPLLTELTPSGLNSGGHGKAAPPTLNTQRKRPCSKRKA